MYHFTFFSSQWCCITNSNWIFLFSLSTRAIFTMVGDTCWPKLANLMRYRPDILPTHEKYCAILLLEVANMPRTNAREDIRVQKAVGFLERFPNMTVPEAMKLADFAPQEIACKARRMWIYRRWNKLVQKLSRRRSLRSHWTSSCLFWIWNKNSWTYTQRKSWKHLSNFNSICWLSTRL